MSTIYDALRKAGAEHKKAAGLEGKNPEGGGMSGNTKAVVLLIAVVIVFAIAFYRIKGSLEGPKKPVAVRTVITPQAPVAPAAPAGTAAPVAPKPKRAPGTYGLDGVIDAGENSMAIINGKLLKVGETIDNLILKKISPKEVELLNTKDNSTVVLKI